MTVIKNIIVIIISSSSSSLSRRSRHLLIAVNLLPLIHLCIMFLSSLSFWRLVYNNIISHSFLLCSNGLLWPFQNTFICFVASKKFSVSSWNFTIAKAFICRWSICTVLFPRSPKACKYLEAGEEYGFWDVVMSADSSELDTGRVHPLLGSGRIMSG